MRVRVGVPTVVAASGALGDRPADELSDQGGRTSRSRMFRADNGRKLRVAVQILKFSNLAKKNIAKTPGWAVRARTFGAAIPSCGRELPALASRLEIYPRWPRGVVIGLLGVAAMFLALTLAKRRQKRHAILRGRSQRSVYTPSNHA